MPEMGTDPLPTAAPRRNPQRIRNPRPSSTGCRQVWHKRRKKKTPTRALDPDDEKPATHPNESSTVNSAAAETKELRRGAERESANDAEKSRPTTENPQENSREPDSYERSSEREHSESRGNKRKNISGDSDEQQQEEPGFMNEQIPHDASSIPPNLSRLIPCSCGQLIRIRRNKSSRKTTPNFHQPIYCERCTAAFIRCTCTSFSIIRINNRLKSFQIKKCEHTYEPDPADLNATVN
ncbi:unnamed protein product [Clavelina lepadiformis]|uniref:Uncharacterized protein n=1 Tax=Clavelina lepadiformis TaxID=159417 RepID=A0ABP0GEE3_CLALP